MWSVSNVFCVVWIDYARRPYTRAGFMFIGPPTHNGADVRCHLCLSTACLNGSVRTPSAVLAKCYGGDISRKRKLLDKQKKGKKRLRQFGKVNMPQEAFMAIVSVDRSSPSSARN